jgi:hypothetical protein
LVLRIKGALAPSKGLTATFILGTLTIMTTMVRFITLKVGTGQPNLVCESSAHPIRSYHHGLTLTVKFMQTL